MLQKKFRDLILLLEHGRSRSGTQRLLSGVLSMMGQQVPNNMDLSSSTGCLNRDSASIIHERDVGIVPQELLYYIDMPLLARVVQGC